MNILACLDTFLYVTFNGEGQSTQKVEVINELNAALDALCCS